MEHEFLSLSRKEAALSLFYLAAEFLVLPGALLAAAEAAGLAPSPVLLNVVFYFLNALFLCLICRNFLGACIRQLLKNPKPVFLTAGAGLMLYFLFSRGLEVLIALVFPDFQNLNNAYLADMARSQWLLLAVGVVLLVPPAEELLFRGAVFGPLFRRRPWAGYLVSMLAFSAVHVMGYLGQLSPLAVLLSLIQYLPAGFFLAWAYRRTGNLFTSILMHSFINIIGVFTMR